MKNFYFERTSRKRTRQREREKEWRGIRVKLLIEQYRIWYIAVIRNLLLKYRFWIWIRLPLPRFNSCHITESGVNFTQFWISMGNNFFVLLLRTLDVSGKVLQIPFENVENKNIEEIMSKMFKFLEFEMFSKFFLRHFYSWQFCKENFISKNSFTTHFESTKVEIKDFWDIFLWVCVTYTHPFSKNCVYNSFRSTSVGADEKFEPNTHCGFVFRIEFEEWIQQQFHQYCLVQKNLILHKQNLFNICTDKSE